MQEINRYEMIRSNAKEKTAGKAEFLTSMIEAAEKLAEVVLNLLNRGYLFESSIQKPISDTKKVLCFDMEDQPKKLLKRLND